MDTNKYSKGKIYKIVDVGYNKCYIGSTCEELSQRMARHRHTYNSFLNGKSSHVRCYDLFKEFGYENCKIELIEYFECNDRNELRKREGYHIQKNECVNRNIAGRTNQEYREVHKEVKQEYDKQYREENKDRKRETDKQYREKNDDVIKAKKKEYRMKNKAKIKEHDKLYYEQNKELLAQKHHEKYENNKEYFKARSKCYYDLKKNQKFQCPCGSECVITEKSKHEKTKKHIAYLNSL